MAKTAKGSSAAPDLARLEGILELMGKHQIAELEWERQSEKIVLRTAAAQSRGTLVMSAPAGMPGLTHAAPAPAAHAPAPSAATKPADSAKAAPAAASNQKQVLSPFVGTFYRAASPTAEPYVKEGQAVKRGDVLCIIEAMKLMNEIESEFNGKVVQCLAENGQPVEFGEPLFLIET